MDSSSSLGRNALQDLVFSGSSQPFPSRNFTKSPLTDEACLWLFKLNFVAAS